jgi:hypothetical protein
MIRLNLKSSQLRLFINIVTTGCTDMVTQYLVIDPTLDTFTPHEHYGLYWFSYKEK